MSAVESQTANMSPIELALFNGFGGAVPWESRLQLFKGYAELRSEQFVQRTTHKTPVGDGFNGRAHRAQGQRPRGKGGRVLMKR